MLLWLAVSLICSEQLITPSSSAGNATFVPHPHTGIPNTPLLNKPITNAFVTYRRFLVYIQPYHKHIKPNPAGNYCPYVGQLLDPAPYGGLLPRFFLPFGHKKYFSALCHFCFFLFLLFSSNLNNLRDKKTSIIFFFREKLNLHFKAKKWNSNFRFFYC